MFNNIKMSTNDEDAVAKTFKILLLGDTGVGKSSLLCYQKEGEPRLNILSTVGTFVNYTVRDGVSRVP